MAAADDIGHPCPTIIHCAIASTDVITTARYIGETNKDDHQAAVAIPCLAAPTHSRQRITA